MCKIRFTEPWTIAVLKSVEAGIAEATYYNWKSKYCGMLASEIKKLEDENWRLKQMFADLSLKKRALKDVIEKKL
jgi:putative transposase